jgi:pimeloyl-ACP methyl ester carboxylesterase
MIPRTWKGNAYPALVAGLATVALAAAPVRATVLAGAGPTQAAAFGPVVPAQAQQPPNVETSLAILHQRLGITPAQEPAFAALANVMRENARTAPGGPPPANADAVYQLRYAIRYAQEEVDGMRRMLPALESLYGVLSPQQRAIANQVFRQGPGQ